MSLHRTPAFAGQFYPASRLACEEFIDRIGMTWPAIESTAFGSITPHAGWSYSGSTAARGIAALKAVQLQTVVVFGAVHVADLNRASLYPAGEWETPFECLRVDEELARRIAAHADVTICPEAHDREHSIEVELPLVAAYLGAVQIVPLMIRPGPWAGTIGRCVARAAVDLGRSIAVIASTDLTHYGPHFGFEPHGRGEAGVRWAKEVNDRRFISCVGNLEPEAIVPEAEEHRNACGAGAVAAGMAAARELGAAKYVELEHTSSAEIERRTGHATSLNSVGYQAGLFLR